MANNDVITIFSNGMKGEKIYVITIFLNEIKVANNDVITHNNDVITILSNEI